jgi:hypothetical protein
MQAKQIRGVAEFIERITRDADELWNAYDNESCLKTYENYVDFLQGKPKATFIRFKNLRELPVLISANVISKGAGIGRMPRRCKYINKKTVNQLIQGAT